MPFHSLKSAIPLNNILSPLFSTLVSSAALLIWLKKQGWNNNRIEKAIASTAPFVSGVYLIHENILVRPFIWDRIKVLQMRDSYMFYPYVIAMCLAIFLLCIIADYVRSLIFCLLGTMIKNNSKNND